MNRGISMLMRHVLNVVVFFSLNDPALPGQLLTTAAPWGRYGGNLNVAERSEPKTLNPANAMDGVSKQVIGLMMGDLAHIDHETQECLPALASRVEVSRDGRRFVLHLRRGIRFSDGEPFDADDVLFTFQVYSDEKIHAAQRDLLIVDGRPISIHKVDANTVTFELPRPYGPGTRLFDSMFILPRHLLKKAYDEGTFAKTWGLDTKPSAIAGLGPFRFREYIPGQRLVLERNPYYWKQDSANHRLPYLDTVTFEYAGNEDAQALRFRSGAADAVSRIGARNFDVLSKTTDGTRVLQDVGPSLEYDFLFFNLNDLTNRDLPKERDKQRWFREVNFRRAISAAIDREGIARLVFGGHATPILTSVTPGNKRWVNRNVLNPVRSLDRARQLLVTAGFSWNRQGQLADRSGHPVEFSILTNANNAERVQMATMIQQDLSLLGIQVRVVSLEFRATLDRVTNSFDYEACLLGLISGDVDPGSDMNLWLSSGSTHLWHLGEGKPTGWQVEIDQLMSHQMQSVNFDDRKRMYDRVQQIVAEYLPVIGLVSPNLLVGRNSRLRNVRPGILAPYVLWNSDELYWAGPGVQTHR